MTPLEHADQERSDSAPAVEPARGELDEIQARVLEGGVCGHDRLLWEP